MNSLKLISDFHDFYDCWFDRNAETEFRRVTTDGFDRIQMFDFFSKKKEFFNPAEHGFVRDIWKKSRKLVVYTDLKAHRGEGKLLLPSDQAIEQRPNSFASVYIESEAKSYRILQIGDMAFHIDYASDDKWRSNVGDVKVEVASIDHAYDPLRDYALVAVDYVMNRYGEAFAVDLNIAPGIGGTGVEDFIKGKEIVDLLVKHMGIK